MKIDALTLKTSLENVRKLMPKQGPIEKFIPSNTLQDFEKWEFHQALCHMQSIKGSRTYMEHESYIKAWQDARISEASLLRVYAEEKENFLIDLNELIGLDGFETFKKILRIPQKSVTSQSISWHLEQSLALQCPDHWLEAEKPGSATRQTPRERKAAVLREIFEKISALSRGWQEPEEASVTFLWDTSLLKKANQITCDFLASFYDEGVCYFPLERSPEGLIKTFIQSQFQQELAIPHYLRVFQDRVQAFPESSSADAQISFLLERFPSASATIEIFLFSCMQDIQGWAGIICHYESHPGQPSFTDLVALRLLIFCALGLDKSLLLKNKSSLKPKICLLYEALLFCLQSDFSREKISNLDHKTIHHLLMALKKFSNNERLKCLHKAYEYHFYTKIANSLTSRASLPAHNPAGQTATSFRAVFCIDEREESIRRHLEELDPQCETFGFAGFFNMDILFKRKGGKRLEALCPIVIKPTRIIEESEGTHSGQQRFFSKRIFSLRRFLFQKSRTFFWGSLLHFNLLIFTLFADFIRFLSPRFFSYLVKTCRQWIDPSHGGKIDINHHVSSSSSSFSFTDFADKVEAMLRTIGLTEQFTELTFIISHGSTNVNNPHYSAYDCGACSGQKGSPNARVFCGAINHPTVRNLLRVKGIDIPSQCWFIPAYHDTCNDELRLFDLEDLPLPIQRQVTKTEKIFLQACMRNAQERARRFESVPFVTAAKAYSLVQARSLKYAQPRPEYDHATNALCFVGRRSMTKGIFFDRRAFLCSYDGSLDHDGTILVNLLSAIVPVCSGINLMYYFSRIDNEVFGAGTKLPHNVTSMIGVVNGAGGDLRTGLHWQTVEIHEPVRLLIVIETTLAKLRALEDKLPNLFRLVRNHWVYLAVFDEQANTLTYLDGRPVSIEKINTPTAKSSTDFFYGKRVHLDPCYIGGRV